MKTNPNTILAAIMVVATAGFGLIQMEARAGAFAITPLEGPVLAGKPVTFNLQGDHSVGGATWDFGDGSAETKGASVSHTYEKPGLYRVRAGLGKNSAGAFKESSSAIVRVHTEKTVHLPQLFLDTDARNEVDDQHYIAYGLFSNADVLGINSIHHGGNPEQEPMNYGEVLYVINRCRRSKLLEHRPANRLPAVYHGAPVPLRVPESGDWEDTEPVMSEASEAILAAARGASPENPVWVLPVGPCTNVASAILRARREGLELKSRIRIVWLGGGPDSAAEKTFNGRNDPWSVYVTGRSGVDFWIMLENPTGASITIDKRTEFDLYPKNDLGRYLVAITPIFSWNSDKPKALYDLTTISMVIGGHLGKDWLTLVEPSVVHGPDQEYRWEKTDAPGASVRIIRDIDEEAMKTDFFNTLNSKPTELPSRN